MAIAAERGEAPPEQVRPRVGDGAHWSDEPLAVVVPTAAAAASAGGPSPAPGRPGGQWSQARGRRQQRTRMKGGRSTPLRAALEQQRTPTRTRSHRRRRCHPRTARSSRPPGPLPGWSSSALWPPALQPPQAPPLRLRPRRRRPRRPGQPLAPLLPPPPLWPLQPPSPLGPAAAPMRRGRRPPCQRTTADVRLSMLRFYLPRDPSAQLLF